MPLRDVSPFFSKLRAVLLGRQHDNPLRFAEKIATRSPNPPDLPEGPSHKLAFNYYYTRDARREVNPPTVISDAAKALEAGDGSAAAKSSSKAPGKLFRYSEFSSASPL